MSLFFLTSLIHLFLSFHLALLFCSYFALSYHRNVTRMIGRLDGPEIESRWGRDFSHPSTPALGPTHPPTMGTGSFPGVKRPGRGVNPLPSSAEVEGRVELYICSHSGPSWPVLGRTLWTVDRSGSCEQERWHNSSCYVIDSGGKSRKAANGRDPPRTPRAAMVWAVRRPTLKTLESSTVQYSAPPHEVCGLQVWSGLCAARKSFGLVGNEFRLSIRSLA